VTRTAVLPDDALPRDGAAPDGVPAPPATPRAAPSDGLHALAAALDRGSARLAAALMSLAGALHDLHASTQKGEPR
jgi:hypothetical protein